MAGALPADGIGHFAVRASLFREHDTATIAAQPAHGLGDKLGVGHDTSFLPLFPSERKWLESFRTSMIEKLKGYVFLEVVVEKFVSVSADKRKE